MKMQFLLLASTVLLTASAVAQSATPTPAITPSPLPLYYPLYNEPYRPQYHFSPPIQFMNDPNGLVYSNGIYHLYYQYNPLQLVAGNQSWGHATSTDLIHWVNANPQIAIPQILSGPLQGQIF